VNEISDLMLNPPLVGGFFMSRDAAASPLDFQPFPCAVGESMQHGLQHAACSGTYEAIRVKPGYQRMAKAIEGCPEDRRGESIIERNLRNANIDVYMPAFWKELRKHRSRKLVERRMPLLVGYVFVRRDPRDGFDPVREVDGVGV